MLPPPLRDRTHDVGITEGQNSPLSALPSKTEEPIPLELHLACLSELIGQTLVP